MKKRNLIILLLMPFIISLFGLTSINMTFNIFDNDIIDIKWEYDDYQGFKVSESEAYLLKATAISDSKYPSKANSLKWSLKNKDGSGNEYARIKIDESTRSYYLEAISEGEVIITCSNEKGNVSRSMTGIIYENGYVAMNPIMGSSQNNVSERLYYGQYDLDDNGVEVKASSIEYNVSLSDEIFRDSISINYSDDIIDCKLSNDHKLLTIDIKNYGDAYVKLSTAADLKDYMFEFTIVKDGINVYDYDDLLYCTNKSDEGKIVVLRKSFDSIKNTYKTNGNGGIILTTDGNPELKQNNTALFGNCKFSKDRNGNVKYSFNFKDEIYRFKTTYNHEYIDQWNEFVKSNSKLGYSEVSKDINVGIHVQKDFYGNGYTLNLHNLTYPYSEQTIDGNIIPYLSSENLFRGPLPFYTLGDPNGTPLVSAYGQDNIGMYVDGDNITVNDLVLRNCDFGNNLANLDYTGTVIEVSGNNITLMNSRFSNGKNVLRSFSSKNVMVDNCMFSYSRNFLITTGSNEIMKADSNVSKEYYNSDGAKQNYTLDDYLSIDENNQGEGDKILNGFLSSGLGNSIDNDIIKESITYLQQGLDNNSVEDKYYGNMTINNSYFYKSGIASIALETAFNGPYLYSNSPSIIGQIFGLLNDDKTSKPLVPYSAKNVSGTSYPVKVNLTGKTTFYDYKQISDIDLSGLISENISQFANGVAGDLGISGEINRKITIDDIFPIKNVLNKSVGEYLTAGKINIPIAYYGGGLNLSTVDTSLLDTDLSGTVETDLFREFLNLPTSGSTLTLMKYMMQKCVTVVTGFHPFKFSLVKGTDEDVNLAPSVEILKDNAKGGN